MEEILQELLSEVKGLKAGQKQLVDGQKQLVEDVRSMKLEISTINKRLDTVEKQMITKEDMDENTRILRALEHASQVNAADMEGLKLNTATKDSIKTLDTKFNILNERLFEQEVQLRLIK